MKPKSAQVQISDWFRYPAAVVAAFLASFATAVLFGSLAAIIRITPGSHPLLVTVAAWCIELSLGFSGVFVGSLCFRRSKRIFGSILLLLLGVGFAFRFLYDTTVGRGDSFPFGYFSLIAIGGTTAVIIIYWRQQPNQAAARSPAP
jgi:hypothetical protein